MSVCVINISAANSDIILVTADGLLAVGTPISACH